MQEAVPINPVANDSVDPADPVPVPLTEPAPGPAGRTGRSRFLWVGALATLLLLSAAGLGLAMLGNVTRGQRLVTHTIEVQLQAEHLRTDLRGLGRAALDALASGAAAVPDIAPRERLTQDDLAQLQLLVQDNPQQTQRVLELTEALGRHMVFLRQLHADDAAALASRRERAELIEAQIGVFIAEETRLLQQRQQELTASVRWQALAIVVLGLLALATLLGTGVIWLQLARERVRADVAAERNRALEQARDRLEILARQLLAVEESERRALSRELHDDLGQRLAALKMNIQLAQTLQPDPPPMLRDAVAIADDCITQVRRRAFSLRPAPLDQLGLASALQSHVEEQVKPAGVQAEVQVDLRGWRPADSWSSHVFRIVQEAVRNALVHGRPRRVQVLLAVADDGCTLRVIDDGVGYAGPRDGGMGLVNMRERCELLGGQFEIGPVPPGGTCVRCWWPAVRPAAPHPVPAPD